MIAKLVNRYVIKGKAKTVAALVGMSLATFLFISIMIVSESLILTIENDAMYRYGSYHVALVNATDSENIRFINDDRNEKIAIKKRVGYSEYAEEMLDVFEVSSNWFSFFNCSLIKGDYPSDSNEIIIPESIYEIDQEELNVGNSILLDIHLRDEYYVASPFEVQYDGSVCVIQTYRIVGIYDDDGRTTITPSDTSSCIYSLCDNSGTEKSDFIYAKLKNVSDVFDIENEYSTENIVTNNEYLSAIGYSATGESTYKTIVLLCYILITIVAVAVVLFVGNAYMISYNDDVKEMGILSSLGADTKQLIKILIGKSILISLISIPIGLFMGIVFTVSVIDYVGPVIAQIAYVESDFCYNVSSKSVFLVIVINVAVSLIASVRPIMNAKKISPIELIKENKVGKRARRQKKNYNDKIEIYLSKCYYNATFASYISSVISIGSTITILLVTVYICNASIIENSEAYNNRPFDIMIHANFDSCEEYNSWYDKSIVDNKDIDSIYSYIETEDQINVSDILGNADGVSSMANQIVVTDEEFRHLCKLCCIDDNRVSAVFTGNSILYELEDNEIICEEKSLFDESDIFSVKHENNEKEVLAIPWNVLTEVLPCFEMNEGMLWIVSESAINSAENISSEYVYVFSEKYEDVYEKLESAEANISLYNLAFSYEHEKSSLVIIKFFLYFFMSLIFVISMINMYFSVLTSVVAHKKDYVILQSIGIEKRQLRNMLVNECLHQVKSVYIFGYGCTAVIFGIYGVFNNFSFKDMPYGCACIIAVCTLVIYILAYYHAYRKIYKTAIIEEIKSE